MIHAFIGWSYARQRGCGSERKMAFACVQLVAWDRDRTVGGGADL